VARFEQEVQHAGAAGAAILRTVCLSGRRYENFASLDAFQAFRSESVAALERAEPVLRKHGVKLAVENHKDWRAPELIDLLRQFDSEWIGVTLDMGNNISLLEDPMAVVEALAPYAITTHFKDMAMEEYEDGFLLSEVPLGQGFLDLPRMVAVCRQHNPSITFNLEMITRDPLKVPCLTEPYWATFEAVPPLDLADALRLVRSHPPIAPLPRVEPLDPEQRLAFEEENNRSSFAFAQQLGLA
jgi:sugar phosphate isomerase/epimerase